MFLELLPSANPGCPISDAFFCVRYGIPQLSMDGLLRRAFDAAGWTTADQLTSAATFQTVKTLTGNRATFKPAIA